MNQFFSTSPSISSILLVHVSETTRLTARFSENKMTTDNREKHIYHTYLVAFGVVDGGALRADDAPRSARDLPNLDPSTHWACLIS